MSYVVLLQGKMKYLAVHHFFPSAPLGLAKESKHESCMWLLPFGLAPANHLRVFCKTQG